MTKESNMNERLEIEGDWWEDVNRELEAEAERERIEAHEGAPVVELDEDELEDWYQAWLADQDDPARIDPDWPDRYVI